MNPTLEYTTLNRISAKLAAHAALTLLFHSHGDERGLGLAEILEQEAHALWCGMGMTDVSTFELAAIATPSP